ncbi:MAG: hypothetical protein A2150_08415 [Candidatus Muproteobacteria bacterium RBG_16_64_11]|uniref:DUF4148 domain-containing protein n=1 Tax=Candidatus Muproteobacteria bacterium RBG_16_64_11 TaxID=1817758 RepID=A0A1F6TDF9_9PROT|nr:MAG: hypothetical protein A2150_08415 [Candidatus Muproteobacteria bacterium RBG_16_64_11]
MKMQISRTVRHAVAVAVTAAAFAPLAAMAAEDFTRYSNEEFVQQRSQVQNLGEADRLRYREEMQNRARNMSAEERSRLGIGRDGAQTERTQTRERTRTGEDNDRGQGEMERERERTEQHDAGSYGRGYEARQGGSGGSMSGGMGGSRGGMGGGGRGGR